MIGVARVLGNWWVYLGFELAEGDALGSPRGL